MITLTDVSLRFSGAYLFKDVNIKFVPGNCYGIIGANGAGKSTFLKLLSGELETTSGEVSVRKGLRISVLSQDHFAFDPYSVLDTIMSGNARLYQVLKEKEALYEKGELSEAEGIRAAELEYEFSELGGWEAESEASALIQGLGLQEKTLCENMGSLPAKDKVKILLARALFGNPEILLMDEPTNHLDVKTVAWLEDFLINYEGTVIVVSHDRYFLNNVCTHIVDIDYSSVKLYVGNYDFWYESSRLIQQMLKDQSRKNEEKAKELKSFISRFSANKSKARQATSRKKLLEKISLEELPSSSRKSPYVAFIPDREPGKEILTVENLTAYEGKNKIINNISFRVNKGDKIAFIGENELAVSTLFEILAGEKKNFSGSYKWGISVTTSYFPKDNNSFFDGNDKTVLEWLGQYAKENVEAYLRGFLGRMLFSGDDVFKPVRVLSGGERVRLMFSRMMMKGSNALIVDQPTNHLDLEAITAVNDGLIDFKGIVLFATHDHQFAETVANRIIELTPQGMIDRQTTFDEYVGYKN
jgi:ATPase components of ABC transporters with duplicated ATPase domains